MEPNPAVSMTCMPGITAQCFERKNDTDKKLVALFLTFGLDIMLAVTGRSCLEYLGGVRL